ncbi:MAG: hypothetical protein ABI210_14975, partial [Abditibacteriaceae bacterium]
DKASTSPRVGSLSLTSSTNAEHEPKYFLEMPHYRFSKHAALGYQSSSELVQGEMQQCKANRNWPRKSLA